MNAVALPSTRCFSFHENVHVFWNSYKEKDYARDRVEFFLLRHRGNVIERRPRVPFDVSGANVTLRDTHVDFIPRGADSPRDG